MNITNGNYGILDIDEFEEPTLRILDGGIEQRHNEVYHFENASRENYYGYLFQYTLDGTGNFEQNGISRKLTKDSGFLTPIPENNQYYLDSITEKPWQYIYLHFEGTIVTSFYKKIFNKTGNCFSMNQSSPPIQMLLEFHKKMCLGIALQKYESGEFLYNFLCALLREIEHKTSVEENALIPYAKQYITSNYATMEGIDSLASSLEISPEHFSRTFKEQTGTTAISYLTTLRLQHTMNDLRNTSDTLDIIARRNGFSGSNYLCKVFKKSLGMTPTEYRINTMN